MKEGRCLCGNVRFTADGCCGSTVSYQGDRWPGEIHLHIGAFDDPEALAPAGHAFEDERLSWLKL